MQAPPPPQPLPPAPEGATPAPPSQSPETEALAALTAQSIKLFETLWQNPQDFNSWTKLVSLLEKVALLGTPEEALQATLDSAGKDRSDVTDKNGLVDRILKKLPGSAGATGSSAPNASDNITNLRKAFDGFLQEFPLCYGYWKKYADYELGYGNAEKAIEVYERGVAAIPKSVDLWVHYVGHLLAQNKGADTVRGVFERGATEVGTDWAAEPLWDKYIALEKGEENWKAVIALLSKLIRLPSKNLEGYWLSYQETLVARPAQEFLPADVSAPKSEEEEKSTKEELKQRAEGFLTKAREEYTKRAKFEASIKRPYFHVKELDKAQQANWNAYVDAEEKEGDAQRIVMLYERCIVPCSNYPKFWFRYIRYLEGKDTEQCRAVFKRATQTFLKTNSELCLAYAKFEEAHDQMDLARNLYQHACYTLSPGQVEGLLAYANFERRQGHMEGVIAVYDRAMTEVDPSATELAFLAMHYARFKQRIMKDIDGARAVYEGAVQRSAHNKELWQAYINFESSLTDFSTADGEYKIQGLFDRALASDSSLKEQDKVELMEYNLDLVSDISLKVGSVRKAEMQLSKVAGSKDLKRARAPGAAAATPPTPQAAQAPVYPQQTAYAQQYADTYAQQYGGAYAQQYAQYAQQYAAYAQQQYAGYQYPAASQ